MFLIIARRCTKGSLKGLSHKKGVVFSLPWAQYCTSQHSESLGGALLREVVPDVQSQKSVTEKSLPCFAEYQVSIQSFRKVVQGNILATGKKPDHLSVAQSSLTVSLQYPLLQALNWHGHCDAGSSAEQTLQTLVAYVQSVPMMF